MAKRFVFSLSAIASTPTASEASDADDSNSSDLMQKMQNISQMQQQIQTQRNIQQMAKGQSVPPRQVLSLQAKACNPSTLCRVRRLSLELDNNESELKENQNLNNQSLMQMDRQECNMTGKQLQPARTQQFPKHSVHFALDSSDSNLQSHRRNGNTNEPRQPQPIEPSPDEDEAEIKSDAQPIPAVNKSMMKIDAMLRDETRNERNQNWDTTVAKSNEFLGKCREALVEMDRANQTVMDHTFVLKSDFRPLYASLVDLEKKSLFQFAELCELDTKYSAQQYNARRILKKLEGKQL